jgi:hypothetical protein
MAGRRPHICDLRRDGGGNRQAEVLRRGGNALKIKAQKIDALGSDRCPRKLSRALEATIFVAASAHYAYRTYLSGGDSMEVET